MVKLPDLGIDMAKGDDSTVEIVPKGRATFNSERAQNYYCDSCHMWVFTQYEGERKAKSIECFGTLSDGHHRITW